MSITEYNEEDCPACGAELFEILDDGTPCCLRCGEFYG
jgi:uncharacterized Zn finger protein (UPF0148 family)